MNRFIEQKLQVVKEFQDKYPNSHVGGSIGLFIRGIDLQRDLRLSDLDTTTPDNIEEAEICDDYDLRSDGNDFDYAISKHISDNIYVKIDVRICPEPSFEVVEFEGVNYNVSKLRDILFWKQKYADKGVVKHKNDLITIETGVRPIEVKEDEFDWF